MTAGESPLPDLKGWEIDIRTLYTSKDWKNRKIYFREDLFEPQQKNCCVLLHHIGEVGVNKDIARAAVFSSKKNAELTFKISGYLFWYFGDNSVQFNSAGNIAFLSVYSQSINLAGQSRAEIFLYILDITKKQFTCLDMQLPDFPDVKQTDASLYKLTCRRWASPPGSDTVEETKILDLSKVEWRSFDKTYFDLPGRCWRVPYPAQP